MHLVLTGATGLVGSGVLDAMIRAKDVTRISILSRRPVKMVEGLNDPRINVITHSDFTKYDSDLLQKLSGASGCVWALGISQSQVSAEEYVKITKDYALEAAKAFADIPGISDSQPFRFIYVSGEGVTHTPGRFSAIFARVKGETELALAEMLKTTPKLRADSVRPAMVDAIAHDAIKPFLAERPWAYRAGEKTLGPVIRTLFEARVSPTKELGEFLTGRAMGKFNSQLSGKGIINIGESKIVENVAFRRLMGL